ncbi:MAG: CPBP family intramembrane metalloprotease [Anaerolineae bacterium]|nr:CPBP family intramembrane metalloprotease [Anaerolineae bacterium]
MNIKTRPNHTFFILLAILTIAVALASFLPQTDNAAPQMPAVNIPTWLLSLVSAGVTLLLYGGLGYLGLTLWRRLDYPEMWEENVSNRQRFLNPALAGAVLGGVFIITDLLFSRINGVGRLMHPPFPTSLVASVSAGIGEEMLFRLFFISFWTWLVGGVILGGRHLTTVYWVVAVFSALAFSAGHFPSLMILLNVSSPAEFPPMLLVQIFLLNGLLSLFAAHYFKKFGFLAAVGIHFWADIIWHVVWGLLQSI